MIHLERNALVWGIVGNLGGGKSLSAVQLGVNALLNGYAVVSNITFDLRAIIDIYNAPWVTSLYFKVSLDDPAVDPYKWPCGDPRGSGGKRRVVVILDEVAEWIDQYASHRDPVVERIRSWLRHSSKRSQDVVLVCQRQEYISKPIRSLVARWIWVDDLKVWRCPIGKFKIPFAGGFVMQNVFDRVGNRIQGCSFVRKATWGRFYNTAECLNSYGASQNSVYDLPDFGERSHALLYSLYVFSLLYLLWLVLDG